MSDNKILEIYTDGACFGNPGPGGWAAVLIWGEHIKKVSGFDEDTTNNRMELLAAIKALESVKNPDVKIKLYTDSQYLKNGMTKWINTWIHTNWNRGKVKNVDLWMQLNDLKHKLNVEWHWVKAHNGLHYNEMVDKLAKSMIDNYLGTK
jgi:ribonuclease HI